jgi:hypothetical protein
MLKQVQHDYFSKGYSANRHPELVSGAMAVEGAAGWVGQ